MRNARFASLSVTGAALALLAGACAPPAMRAEVLQPVRVAADVYALLGTGGEATPENAGRTANVAFVVGPQGVLVVDTGASFRQGEAIIAAVASVTSHPIRLAILTHAGPEAIFGAAAFQAQGIPVVADRRTAELMATRCASCLTNLRTTLGAEAMAGTRVIEPALLPTGAVTLDVIGRPLRVIVPSASSVPGALAVFDATTSTLIAGSLVLIRRIPDLRDADPPAWQAALADLAATHCGHLIAGYGPIGTCADIAPFAQYFVALDARVEQLLRDRVSLVELRQHCELPAFAAWDGYATLNPANALRTYLRLERAGFE